MEDREWLKEFSDEHAEAGAREILEKVGVTPPEGMTATAVFLEAVRRCGIGPSRAVPLPGSIDLLAVGERVDDVVEAMREICAAGEPPSP